jgi:putative restriction endonuclease
VPNGLALCRLHHGAFDRNLLGISPDLEVRLAPEVLDEEDGPMLEHGLREFHGHRINVPRSKHSKPDRDRLAWRYERFLSRSA